MKTVLTALAALLAASLAPTCANADTLVTNANGIQVDKNGKLERFTGILIGDDGKVKRLLHGEMLKLAGDTKVVDAQGRTVMPGLIDAHGHVMGLGFSAIQLDLTGTRSLDEFKQRLKAHAVANPGSGWILGRGWNQELWTDKRFPTAADLDEVVAGRPVWLSRVDGHASVANSAAMRAAGVTAETKAPAGGQIINGLFVDNAEALVAKSIPAPDAATRDRALAEAQRLMLSVGLTAAADMGTSKQDWATLRRAGELGLLQVRVLSYAGGVDALPSVWSNWLFEGRLHGVGVKLYSDGALGSRGAWLKRPYEDKPDTSGLRLLSASELRKQANQASARGYQIAIHAIGDAANEQVISVFEELSHKWGPKRRWRIEHLQIADPRDLPRLKPAGIIASMQPTHQTSDWQMAEARLGKDRLGGAYAWRTVERLGVPLAFGSDFPVEHPNPFPGLAAAISRETIEGKPPGGWLPREKISLASALGAFTRGAAYAGFAEDKIGSLDPGKYADFIIVDRDPAKVDAQALARTKVLETWIAGKREFSADAAPAK